MHLLYALAALLCTLVAAGELDTSCKVSVNCMTRLTRNDVTDYIAKLVSKLPGDGKKTTYYANGQNIVCRQYALGPHGFCLFFEGVKDGGVRTARTAKRLMGKIQEVSDKGADRGCGSRCGMGWDKSWGGGVLKLDYVTDSCVDICDAGGRMKPRPGQPAMQ